MWRLLEGRNFNDTRYLLVIIIIVELYELQNGTLLIDENDIREISFPSFRNQMAIVSHDFFLFSASVRENLILGNPNAG